MEFETPAPPPASHVWMLGLSLGSLVMFMALHGEGHKMLVGLFTFVLMVIVWITCLAWLAPMKPYGWTILLAALASLGSCGGQITCFGYDLNRIIDDMTRFDCREARRIARTHHGFGREWVQLRDRRWRADASGPLGFHDLYLTYRPGPDYYELAVPMPDMPRAYAECTPDPAKPAAVNVINSPGGLLPPSQSR